MGAYSESGTVGPQYVTVRTVQTAEISVLKQLISSSDVCVTSHRNFRQYHPILELPPFEKDEVSERDAPQRGGQPVGALFRGWPLLKIQIVGERLDDMSRIQIFCCRGWPYSTPVARNLNLVSLELDFYRQVIDRIHLSVFSSTEKFSMNANNGVQIDRPMGLENQTLSPLSQRGIIVSCCNGVVVVHRFNAQTGGSLRGTSKRTMLTCPFPRYKGSVIIRYT